MYPVPKNVKPKKGLNVVYQFVDKSYILKAGDLVRSTRYPNFTDSVMDCYVKEMNWQKAEDALSGWVGRTIDEIERNLGKGRHEFMQLLILKNDVKKSVLD